MISTTTKRRSGAIARDGAGRITPFEPTVEQRKLVEKLAGIGVTHDEICLVIDWGRPDGLPITANTLRRRCRQELNRGKAIANTRIKQSLFNAAASGHFGSQVFWLKTQCGWKETAVTELVGKDGSPLPGAGPVLYLPAKDPREDGRTHGGSALASSVPVPVAEAPQVLPAPEPASASETPRNAYGRLIPLDEHINKRFRI